MNEAYRMLYLLSLPQEDIWEEELLELAALAELMRQRSRASVAYHLTPRGIAALESARANDSRTDSSNDG